jgi:site-specific DNA-methyltransferase (cytosine-N4-specific)
MTLSHGGRGLGCLPSVGGTEATPTYFQTLIGDVREMLAELPDESVHCVVTSPPYFRQRDYGVEGQIGQEATPAEFADALSEVFTDVRRVLRSDGVLWLNLGDTYAAGGNGGGGSLVAKRRQWTGAHERKGWRRQSPGFKQKDITLAPFVVADTLRADGWYLRSTIVWNKQTATEPPRLDRPSTAHEYLFLLAKSQHYRVRDPGEPWWLSTVWTIRPQPTHTGHPAVMPAELARRCIVCSSEPGDTILDPFGGPGTTAMVARGLNRNAILIERNPTYAAIADARVGASGAMFGAAPEGLDAGLPEGAQRRSTSNHPPEPKT